MKLSDYIVEWLYKKGIKDFYGYQGTMIAHFVDSIGKNPNVKNYSCYNEQAAAFAACGHALASEKCSVAYATSGPGAINLLSGIANAFYDSIPIIFITGQINRNEYRRDIPNLRQNAFQETKIVEMSKCITKYAVQILDPSKIKYELEKAFYLAMSGRKGPVLLDIPMDVQRANIEPENLKSYVTEIDNISCIESGWDALKKAINYSNHPVLLLGNGVSRTDALIFIEFSKYLNIPIVTSLLAKGHIPSNYSLNFGYLGGAYGNRYANLIVSLKSDQLVAVGISLCTRQTGVNVAGFAKNSHILRYDIDPVELTRKINNEEESFLLDSAELASMLRARRNEWSKWKKCDLEWTSFCKEYREACEKYDSALEIRYPNKVIESFNKYINKNDIIVSDVGQHMMWVAQSLKNPSTQPVLFSGGHGAMGFAIPAGIGAGIAHQDSKVFCFCGDGATQMNIQELQWVSRDHSNLVIVVLNNNSLGLIKQQQSSYFNKMYYGAGYPYFTSPSFSDIAKAYGISAVSINKISDIPFAMSKCPTKGPYLIEYVFNLDTMALPKTIFGEPIYDQEPRLPIDIKNHFGIY